MRGRGGWGEPKAPTPDLGPRASFPHWPWAAPAPHLKGKRVGDRKVQPFCLGGGFTGLPAWPWGTSPTAPEPAARRASCPIAWVPVAGGHSRRSGQALGCAARAPRTVVSLLSQPGLQGACSASHGSPRLSMERDRRRPGPRALFVPAGGSSDTDSETERLLRPEVTARPGRVVGRPSAPTQSQVRGAKGASRADGTMQTPQPQAPRTPLDCGPACATQRRLPPPRGQDRSRQAWSAEER